MSTGLREGVVGRWRLGGHGGMGSGVKVRAELDRVSGLTLRPDPIGSTMWAGCRRSSRALDVSLLVVLLGYVSSVSGPWGWAGKGR